MDFLAMELTEVLPTGILSLFSPRRDPAAAEDLSATCRRGPRSFSHIRQLPKTRGCSSISLLKKPHPIKLSKVYISSHNIVTTHSIGSRTRSCQLVLSVDEISVA